MKKMEIRIAGFGGQGVVLLGNIMGKAASIYNKRFAALTQSYGPESRGGSCRAELIISESPIEYPYIIDPGIQVILSQEAYIEFGGKASKDTLLIVDSGLVKVDNSPAAQLLSIPASRMAQEMGRPVVANIIMLGFLAAHSNIISREALERSIKDFIPAGTESFNMKAFEMGYHYSLLGDRPA
ncbi:MAG: 2-oxoacid:acceptor oxidoreductase family protein [Chloroflexi bacterium]|nr:2-oxoacid:acceptor oxidoreductase family protein [Chloroflexota bacterium]